MFVSNKSDVFTAKKGIKTAIPIIKYTSEAKKELGVFISHMYTHRMMIIPGSQ